MFKKSNTEIQLKDKVFRLPCCSCSFTEFLSNISTCSISDDTYRKARMGIFSISIYLSRYIEKRIKKDE